MENERMNSAEERNLRWWSRVLFCLALLGIGWIVVAIGNSLFGSDFRIAMYTANGLESLTQGDLTWSQRAILVAIFSVPDLCWAYCMWQVAAMARCFSRHEILTASIVNRLQRFGFGIVGLSITEPLLIPVMNIYLQRLKKMSPIESISDSILGSGFHVTLMAAVLIMILARILRIGIRLREEAELTI
jgi:hypothetical protein